MMSPLVAIKANQGLRVALVAVQDDLAAERARSAKLREALDVDAMELAAGLCESESNRYPGKTGEHWLKIATRLRGSALAVAALAAAPAAPETLPIYHCPTCGVEITFVLPPTPGHQIACSCGHVWTVPPSAEQAGD